MKIQKHLINLALLLAFLSFACEKENNIQPFPSSEFVSKGSYTGDYWPTEGWRNCKPEAVEMDSYKLKELNDEILLLLKLHIDINSVLIIRKGYIVAEQYYSDNYGIDSLHAIHSCTKSITSALMGIAIDKGYISSVNSLMTGFFTDYEIENLTNTKEQITLKHMLTMSAGLDWHELDYLYQDNRNTFRQWISSADQVKFVLDRPMVENPGENWNYSTGLSHLLSSIIQKSTGMRLDSFAFKNIFTPLGIEKYYWPIDEHGVGAGGYGVKLTPRDMAKFGYLYLKKGIWDDERIVSEQWVEVSHQKHIERYPNSGYYYGYHWWINSDNSYSAVGYGGQWITIFPELDLLVVFTNQFTDGDDFQWNTADRLIKTYILPALK